MNIQTKDSLSKPRPPKPNNCGELILVSDLKEWEDIYLGVFYIKGIDWDRGLCVSKALFDAVAGDEPAMLYLASFSPSRSGDEEEYDCARLPRGSSTYYSIEGRWEGESGPLLIKGAPIATEVALNYIQALEEYYRNNREVLCQSNDFLYQLPF